MDLKALVEKMSLSNYPVGLGGCHANGINYKCCEYNITVFDDKKGESVHEVEGEMIKIHHRSFSETNPAILKQLENLQILSDNQWKLRMFLS